MEMNGALKSFFILLSVLVFFMVINILSSVSYLHRVLGVSRMLTSQATAALRGNMNQPRSTTRAPVLKLNSTAPNSVNTSVLPTQGPTPRPDSCQNCFGHNFSYLIQNTSICGPGNQSTDLMMFIFTVHQNTKQRNNIRATWASIAKNNTGNVRYAFLLGWSHNKQAMDAVYAESEKHHDILMEDFIDAYSNLTYKTMMAMKWASTFCSQARYVLKTDDDMWVNVPELLTLLDKRGHELERGVGGACSPAAKPIRNKKSKWYASVLSYPFSRYPGFCSGTGYVTSLAVAKKIYQVSPGIPFFHLEDVYVALCIKKLGMKLIKLPGFHNYRTALKPCEMRSSKIITSHMVPTNFLHKIMNEKC